MGYHAIIDKKTQTVRLIPKPDKNKTLKLHIIPEVNNKRKLKLKPMYVRRG